MHAKPASTRADLPGRAARRAKVQKNGYGGGGGPGGSPERPALLLLKGKAGRTESPPAAIADALGALLAAAQLAGAAAITPQVGRLARAVKG
jgi:hypothetical protein